MSSALDPSHQKEIDLLVQNLTVNRPKDVLRHCAEYFNKRLSSERGTALPDSTSLTAATMAQTAGPFDQQPQRGLGSADEDEEARDSFGAGTFNSNPFGSRGGSGGFGGSSGGSGGGLFGSWGGQTMNNEDAAQHTPANFPGAGRRVSVSAEAMQPDADSSTWKAPRHPKTDGQLERLKRAVASNFLFAHLDDDSFSTVLDALAEKQIPAANIRVINQGEEGDYFYVIEDGTYDVYIHKDGAPAGNDMGNKVASVEAGGSFGELALMYNAPRAATIVSTSRGHLWQLDRMTFRKILMTNASERRKMYEGFLEDVPLLDGLKPYERSKIADALETVKYASGQHIIKEGEPGEDFFMLEAGEAEAIKNGVDHPVKQYSRGDFFGELALLNDKPRAASVVAKTDVKVARLGRDGFKRLLGPVESMMRSQDYEGQRDLDPLHKETTVT